MKKFKVTMDYIAKEMNVTKSTVSKALNNQPGVSEELRSSIVNFAQGLEYKNSIKSATYKMQKLAYIVPKRFFFENEIFYTIVYYYLNKICLDNGINLSIFIVNSEEERSLIVPQFLTSSNFDGIFVAGEIKDEYLAKLQNIKIPIVYIGFYNYDVENDCIIVDDIRTSYLLTEYLIKAGHKSIGYVGEYASTSSYMDRYLGYRKALIRHKLPYDENMTFYITSPMDFHYTLDFELPGTLPTAFICQNDMDAHFLIEKLSSKGYKVPNDISVASFDNSKIAEKQDPQLTSVDIDKEEFARMAFERMSQKIKDPSVPVQRFYAKTHIVVRDSVKTI